MNKPKIYQKANGVQRRDAGEVLDSYFELLRWKPSGGDRILDIGCGSGDVTFDLVRPRLPGSFGELVGSDISDKMVYHARETYADPKMEFINLDISKPVPGDLEETFDHVMSFYCLHWIQDQRQAMENVYNLLRPGGDTLFCLLAKNPIYDVYTNMSKMSKWKQYMEDVQKFISPYQKEEDPERTLRTLLLDIGFEADVCKCQKKTYYYPSLEILQKSVRAVAPFIDRMPDEKMKDDFLVDYVEEIRKMNLIEENNNEKGEKILAPYSLIIVYARKPT